MDTDRKLTKIPVRFEENLILRRLLKILVAYCLIKDTLIFYEITSVKLETGYKIQSHQKNACKNFTSNKTTGKVLSNTDMPATSFLARETWG